jgi:glycosyltransferase involved in cell wall biosynthesis
MKLSYVVTTYNKLPFLKECMHRLVVNKKTDEEIIVVDGGSSDGSQQFLERLFQDQKIDQFLSEKDCGEAHGWNKALLMAKGDLIKIITDDDLFNYEGIIYCREFMETHMDIDILVSCVLNVHDFAEYSYSVIGSVTNPKQFELYRKPVNTCGLGILLRKSSIPLLGLMNPSVVRVDYEYLVRVFYGATNIAVYTSPLAVRLGNSQSNSHKFAQRMDIEKKLITNYYPKLYQDPTVKCDNLTSFLNFLRMIKQLIKKYTSYRKISKQFYNQQNKSNLPLNSRIEPGQMFSIGEQILNLYLKDCQGKIFVNKNR